MSSYTTSTKIQVDTWLDNCGNILGVKRLKNEDLFDYKQRLIDFVQNKPSATIEGTNYSASRNLSLERKHVLTIESTSSKPFIKVTSKYIYFYNDETLDFKFELYNKTWADLKLYIDYFSNYFSVSYYNEDYANDLLKKIFYGSNLKSNTETLKASNLNILSYGYIRDIYLSGDIYKYNVASIAEITEPYQYYIDYENGLIYNYDIAYGNIVYNYFEMPFKLYYNPISFYPLNDEDIDELIKDTVYTDNGNEYLKLNSFGADIINNILAKNPITLGD